MPEERRPTDTKDRARRARRPALRLGAAVIAALLSVCAGCAHPCGYTDVRAVLTPLPDSPADVVSGRQCLKVIREISQRNTVLAVRLEQERIAIGPAILELCGRRTEVPYRWYTPLVKPVVAATIAVPFWLSARYPHRHGGGTWNRWDYFRDVAAWFNICSAIPTGARRVTGPEVCFDAKQKTAVLSEEQVPITGHSVELFIDGKRRAEKTTDKDGEVAFDLALVLTAEDAKENREVIVAAPGAADVPLQLTWTLSAALIRSVLSGSDR